MDAGAGGDQRPRRAGAAGRLRRHLTGRWRRLRCRLRPPVLVLGGGGARGFAHLGVLEVLERAEIRPRAVVGTSMGAVIGAMVVALGSVEATAARWREAYARGLLPPIRPLRRLEEAHEHPLLQVARRIRNRIVVSMAVSRATVLDARILVNVIDFLLPDVDLADLRPPMVAVTTDLGSGEEVRLRSGSLRDAVRASSAIPGLLPAVEIGGRRLVDGGVVAEVPVSAGLAMGWPVLAVDTSMVLPPLEVGGLALDTMMRAQMITSRLLRERQLTMCGDVLRPAVGHATWADWERFDELVEAGRRSAREWLTLV